MGIDAFCYNIVFEYYARLLEFNTRDRSLCASIQLHKFA
jgi:hypothetical protein